MFYMDRSVRSKVGRGKVPNSHDRVANEQCQET
jgi:hypothetical protein